MDINPKTWAEREFGACDLGDRRRTHPPECESSALALRRREGATVAMGIRAFCTVLLFASKLIVGNVVCAAEDPDAVIANLRRYDSVYLSSLAARGTVTHPPPFNALYLPTFEWKWSATYKGDRSALTETTGDVEIPYYPREFFEGQSQGKSLPGVAYDKSDNMAMSIKSGMAVSLERDRTATASISTVFLISPEGRMLSRKDNKTVMYDQADAIQLSVDTRVAAWILGRGFSACLREVTSVSEATDGLLEVTATGDFAPISQARSGQGEGKWILTVDVASERVLKWRCQN